MSASAQRLAVVWLLWSAACGSAAIYNGPGQDQTAGKIGSFSISPQIVPDAAPAPALESAEDANSGFDEFDARRILLMGRLRIANHYYETRQFEKALAEIVEAEQIVPEDSEILNFHGAILAEQKKFDEAMGLFTRSMKSDPSQFWPRYNMAEIALMQGKYKESRAMFGRLLNNTATDEVVYFKIALTHLKENGSEDAELAVQQIQTARLTPAYYFGQAAIEFAKENRAQAIAWLKQAQIRYGGDIPRIFYESLVECGWLDPALLEPTLGVTR